MIPPPKILVGDALEKLRELPDRSVQMCVTSPPYYGLRDYGDPRQIGSEGSPGAYIGRLVAVAQEIWRVLRDDGTFWLNLGDSYYNYRPGAGQSLTKQSLARTDQSLPQECARRGNILEGFKEKDRMMIPARVAIALQDDRWYLRDEIVWHKPNPMPESVTDRTTKAHEFIYLLTKNQDYYYDAEAIRERGVIPEGTLAAKGSAERFNTPGVNSRPPEYKRYDGMRNKRSVWSVNTDSSGNGEHFAVFPPDLIKPCILAGSGWGDTVLDPFAGRGTTGAVCVELGRDCILIELNPVYAKLCGSSVDTTPSLPFL
jgi:DNA modification methylase